MRMKTKQGGGLMIKPIEPVVLDLNQQLDEIIRQLQAAREEFVLLEARMAQREIDNESVH